MILAGKTFLQRTANLKTPENYKTGNVGTTQHSGALMQTMLQWKINEYYTT
jgi:hypothetical protein